MPNTVTIKANHHGILEYQVYRDLPTKGNVLKNKRLSELRATRIHLTSQNYLMLENNNILKYL